MPKYFLKNNSNYFGEFRLLTKYSVQKEKKTVGFSAINYKSKNKHLLALPKTKDLPNTSIKIPPPANPDMISEDGIQERIVPPREKVEAA